MVLGEQVLLHIRKFMLGAIRTVIFVFFLQKSNKVDIVVEIVVVEPVVVVVNSLPLEANIFDIADKADVLQLVVWGE